MAAEALMALPWPLVCGALLWVAHRHGGHYWVQKLEAKRVDDQARLTKVEAEVQQLLQAQNLKGLRHG